MRRVLAAACVVCGSLLVGVTAAGARQLACSLPICTVSVTGGDGHKTADVVGDSITFKSVPDIERSLVAYSYSIRATEGYTMAQMFPAIEQQLARPPDAWIIELGTNDVRSLTNWSVNFENEASALRGQRCVILVTVNPRISAAADALDADMDLLTVENHDFHVLDWGNAEWDNPHWVDADGIHPSGKGSAELAKLMRVALRQDCQR
jgi:lysophospholipase L1-like esterase